MIKKAKAKAIKTAVALEAVQVEACFERTSLGYWRANQRVSHTDAADYVISRLEVGASALRSAILCMSAVIQQDRYSAVYLKKALHGRWGKVTLDNLFSIAKNLPKFEKIGLQIDKVQDIYGLREVSSLIKRRNPERILELFNGGSSPRNAKKTIVNEIKNAEANAFPLIHEKNIGNNFSDKGHEFEKHILPLLEKMQPDVAWEHIGNLKSIERGLDFIGRNMFNHNEIFGVQCKCHQLNACPSDEEWTQFLAGCFTRRVTKAIFITTGRLNANQHREASESGIITLISGQNILNYLEKFSIPNFLTDF